MKRNKSRPKQDRQTFAARKLYGDRALDFLERYRKRKRILVGLCIAVSIALAVVTVIREATHPELIEGKYLTRNDKNGAFKDVTLEASSENGYKKTMQIRVKQQLYTEEELSALWQPFCEDLKKAIFSSGDSADYVSKDLNLQSSLQGYPFRIEWQSEQPLVLSGEGKIYEERLSETEQKQKGIVVNLTAKVTCQDFSEEITIPVRVFGKYLTKEEVFWQQVDKAILEWSDRSAYGTYQKLPDLVLEEPMTYREQSGKEWILLLFCGVTIAVLIVRHMDEDLIKQVKKRDEQLEWEYPGLVNRFVLYYGAGLTIKNIWQRICRDYEDRKKMTGTNCAYEEMLKADRKMQDGVGESEAYTAFATSISLTRYRTLIALLQQTLKSGGADIREQLNEQLNEAFSEQKRNARILGEKAGTRMLLPMFLMLSVVLAVILIPAFLSF